MRSYYDHLKSALPLQEKEDFEGIFRASSIFPVFLSPKISTRVLFLGYWMIKRSVSSLSCLITLRSKEGAVIKKTLHTISGAKAYTIEARDYLAPEIEHFEGSLEIEFFSSKNLVFPYPALVVNYYGPEFSTVVHTAQRVYNNYDDMLRNSENKVKEAGFNIYQDEDITPFIAFINGPKAAENKTIEIEVLNIDQQVLKKAVNIGNLNAYETKILYLKEYFPLETFLKGKPGTARLTLELEWIFPRILAGNHQTKLDALTITHTYYDTSESLDEKNYWLDSSDGFYPASLMIPLDSRDAAFTNVYFYPIYSPSLFAIDIEIFNEQGRKIFEEKNALVIQKEKAFNKIDFQALPLPFDEPYACRLSARKIEGELPARIKLGLDIGYKNSETPCNLCTNLQPFNPQFIHKKHAFKWAPILADQPASSLWIMNSSPEIAYNSPADITLNFYRESDAEVLTRHTVLPPNGFLIIDTDKDAELQEFLQNKVGWAVILTNNPYLTSYYMAVNPSGVVGADHGF